MMGGAVQGLHHDDVGDAAAAAAAAGGLGAAANMLASDFMPFVFTDASFLAAADTGVAAGAFRFAPLTAAEEEDAEASEGDVAAEPDVAAVPPPPPGD